MFSLDKSGAVQVTQKTSTVRHVENVKAWVNSTLPEEIRAKEPLLMAQEVQCSDPLCAPVEVFIAVMIEGRKPFKTKLLKEIADVVEEDVKRAMPSDWRDVEVVVKKELGSMDASLESLLASLSELDAVTEYGMLEKIKMLCDARQEELFGPREKEEAEEEEEEEGGRKEEEQTEEQKGKEQRQQADGEDAMEVSPSNGAIAQGDSMADLLKEIAEELDTDLPAEPAAVPAAEMAKEGTEQSPPNPPLTAPPTSAATVAKAKGVKMNAAPAPKAAGWRARQGKQQDKMKHPESWSKKQKSRHRGPSRPGEWAPPRAASVASVDIVRDPYIV
jgi:hypothetical protein